MLKLNGGLGTSMGLEKAKSLLEVRRTGCGLQLLLWCMSQHLLAGAVDVWRGSRAVGQVPTPVDMRDAQRQTKHDPQGSHPR